MASRRRWKVLPAIAGFLFFLSAGFLRAAEVLDSPDYYIQTLGIEDGLPHQLAHRLIQDKTGFLWISTSGGLVRYEGRRLQLFSSPLLSNRESDVLCAIGLDAAGNVLAAPNRGGLAGYDPGAATFVARADTADFPPGLTAFLRPMPDGSIWVGYFTGRLLRWQNGRSTWFTNGIKAGQTLSVAADGDGKVWVASDDFLARYEDGQLVPLLEKPGTRLCLAEGRAGTIWVAGAEHVDRLEGGKLTRVFSDPPWAARAGRVSVVFQERDGTLWVGTKGDGLFRIEDDKFRRIPTSHPWITDVAQDNEGNIWVTTRGGGVNRIRKKPFHFWQSRSDLLSSGITSVCEDDAGNIWVASNGGGLIQFSKGRMFRHREFREDWMAGVQVICPDGDGYLWMGTRTALVRWDPMQTSPPAMVLTNCIIHALYCRGNGELWAGGERGFVGRFAHGQWTAFAPMLAAATNSLVRCIGEDNQGALWIALSTGELVEYQTEFTLYPNVAGLDHGVVRCMCSDSQGGLWMATTRDGLLLRQDGKFYRVTADQGVPAETIDGILEDNTHLMWFATQAGLYHVGTDELRACALGGTARVEAIPYGRGAGLVGYSLNSGFQPTLWKSRSGNFWMATHRGLIDVEPEMARLGTHRSPVLIDEISLDDRPAAIRSPLVMGSGTRKLEIRLALIDFSAPEQVRIQHRLDGFDSAWVDAGNERSFVYPKLPPGDYRLLVRACNSDGVWSETAEPLLLTVVPGWWQRRWLQAAGITLAVVLLILSVRTWSHRRLQRRLERLEQKQAMEKERARIAKNLHDDLGASLTEIGLLADLARRNGNGNGEAKEVHHFFSDRVRGLARTLDNIVWTVNPKNDSLEELATYLCEFSQELFRLASIRCRLDVAGEIPRLPLSPDERSNLFLTAKEAINNIVKHSGATEVWVGIHMDGPNFCISIRDNGRGFDPAAPENAKRNGLANMRSRIRDLNGSFAIESVPGEGTTISISVRLPVHHHLSVKP
jgi:signal transduction histidine kinase/ligand-binding sensor domain-containing protein